MKQIDSETVRADFNDILAVMHYARAAHGLGLWKSERILIDRFFTDKEAPLLEAGCGAGRVSVALWELGYRQLAGFDFAEDLVAQAQSLADERKALGIHFFNADATRLSEAKPKSWLNRSQRSEGFRGVLFMFNGLMQIPGRENRRRAMRELLAVSAPGAPFLFTTHDRNASKTEQALWRLETLRWEKGTRDPRLVEYGDRYFEHEHGRTFMHLPDREEILQDLAASGWTHEFDSLRKDISGESKAVKDFSDECRFWLARK